MPDTVLVVAVDRVDELVIETEVVVAGRVADALGGNVRPAHVGLTEVARADARTLFARLHKAALLGIHHAALDRVAESVVKRADAVVQLRQVLLVRKHRAVVGVGRHVPRLAVHQNLFAAAVLIQLVERRTDAVHRDHVVQAHQVEAEAVDMVLLRPVGDGVDHVFAEHFVLGGGVVRAARAVGEGAVGVHAVVVVGHRVLEPRVGGIGVVVDHVHNHADARVVKRLDHLLAFADAHRAVGGIGGIGALGHVVVDGVVAPVVLLHDVLALVNRAEVIHRHDLHILDAELFEVVDAGGRAVLQAVDRGAALGEGEELAAVLFAHAAALGGREVRHGHLPHTRLCGVVHQHMCVIFPVFGIGLRQIHHHAALAVDAAGTGIDVGGAHRLLVVDDGKVVVFSRQIAVDGRLPDACFSVENHVGRADGFSVGAVLIQIHRNRLRPGRPDLKGRGLFGIGRAQIVAVIGRLIQLLGVRLIVNFCAVRRQGGRR